MYLLHIHVKGFEHIGGTKGNLTPLVQHLSRKYWSKVWALVFSENMFKEIVVYRPLGLVLYCYLNMPTINKTYLILS